LAVVQRDIKIVLVGVLTVQTDYAIRIELTAFQDITRRVKQFLFDA
jgi:hypothetical protein